MHAKHLNFPSQLTPSGIQIHSEFDQVRIQLNRTQQFPCTLISDRVITDIQEP